MCVARYPTLAPSGRRRQSLQATVSATCSTLLYTPSAALQHQPHARKSPEVLQVRQRVNRAAAAAAVAENLAHGFRRNSNASSKVAGKGMQPCGWHTVGGHDAAPCSLWPWPRCRSSQRSDATPGQTQSVHSRQYHTCARRTPQGNVRQTSLHAPHLHSHVERVQTVPRVLPAILLGRNWNKNLASC